ncbi:MAG: transposase [Gammaproteobacteria bacterium]|nr:transposase [Gammaproteobacteria bacterium]
MSRRNGSSESTIRVRRSYSDDFKRDAVSLVTDQGYRPVDAARSLGIHPNLLLNWRRKFVSEQKQESMTEDEKAELKRLREENRKLRMERDILKKATAFFAKESQ